MIKSKLSILGDTLIRTLAYTTLGASFIINALVGSWGALIPAVFILVLTFVNFKAADSLNNCFKSSASLVAALQNLVEALRAQIAAQDAYTKTLEDDAVIRDKTIRVYEMLERETAKK